MLNNKKIAFVAGTFDGPSGCHEGHIYLLKKMRELVGEDGEVFVGLNFDQYIIDYKKRQPLSNSQYRQEYLYKTGLVTQVFPFYCTPIDLIMWLKPDFIVCGGDYTEDKVIGAKECAEWGGKVIIVPRIPNVSTTNIIKQLSQNG